MKKVDEVCELLNSNTSYLPAHADESAFKIAAVQIRAVDDQFVRMTFINGCLKYLKETYRLNDKDPRISYCGRTLNPRRTIKAAQADLISLLNEHI